MKRDEGGGRIVAEYGAPRLDAFQTSRPLIRGPWVDTLGVGLDEESSWFSGPWSISISCPLAEGSSAEDPVSLFDSRSSRSASVFW